MSHVFISYAQKDARIASLISEGLVEAGIPVWSVTNLKAGDSWQDEINRAITEAASGLLLLSPSAVRSAWTAHEYQTVLALDKPLYVVLIQPVPLEDIPVRLRQLQYIDLSRNFDNGMQSLIEAIRNGKEDIARSADFLVKSDQIPYSVEVKIDSKAFDPDQIASLVTKLAEAGIHEVKVTRTDAE